ncbi:hypothetical protein PSN45_000795 [Yamadazyma tenuis]|uniref:Uncharacterized protein n=1 Tax=Candida tenuis (strain ATCC 10573 / BCRC 21748 / CBS 615 / JCM 9827 / NBRC 10315 / NRRL Y-1498 / VKM Y-70) TaxID=590646 RepID=G3BAQ4_CANTC|nr:uncharacterized protein CANTEDRAFT_115532 [Yamadazyma tenuis ATCC 10573]EGV62080.1 hypothetical protein CANTEDRAFT_115532 [Yamadazyma tenuis ATCC 10573]WEJ93332.1 hypothetical protein PSN45_000795 [Yamadazyma tenuis]
MAMASPIPIPNRGSSSSRLRKQSLIRCCSKSSGDRSLSRSALMEKPTTPVYININSIKSSVNADSHPLEHDFQDSDNDSVFDDSFENSSITSANSSINSSFNSCLSLCSPPTGMNINRKSKGVSQIQLLTINSNSTPSTSPTNLSRLLKSLPVAPTPKPVANKSIEIRDFLNGEPTRFHEALPSVELQTFKTTTATPTDSLWPGCRSSNNFRNRDDRINSSFLKLYAIDFQCRSTGLLPHSNHDPIRPDQTQFHAQHNMHKLSARSRDKLWQSIILAPRSDTTPTPSIDHGNYVFVGGQKSSGNSLTMKHGDILPWSHDNKPSLKPTGILKTCKPLVNGTNPNSGVSHCQYTIKGWSNTRWLECSATAA